MAESTASVKLLIKLMESCWAQDAEKRPTFEDVVHRLKEVMEVVKREGGDSTFMRGLAYIKTKLASAARPAPPPPGQ